MLRKAALISLLVSIFASCASLAQSGGATLQGTVSDPTGAAIPSAHLQILSSTTGVSREAVGNSRGIYTAPNLPAGTYSVTIRAAGFASKTLTDVELTVGLVRDLDIPMTIATSDVSITVEQSVNQVNAA